jgi:hypothetical protein
VSEAVVDNLEAIYIEIQQGAAVVLVSFRLLQGHREAVLKQPPVGQFGQRILQRGNLRLLFCRFQFFDHRSQLGGAFFDQMIQFFQTAPCLASRSPL